MLHGINFHLRLTIYKSDHKSPKDRVVPDPNGLSMAEIIGGY